MNPAAFFAQHRNAVLAGGAGVVVLGAAAVRRRKASSSSPAAAAQGYPPTYDTSQTDSAQQFDQNLQAQEDYINGQVDALGSILAGVNHPVTPRAPRPKAKHPKPKKKPAAHIPPRRRKPRPRPGPR